MHIFGWFALWICLLKVMSASCVKCVEIPQAGAHVLGRGPGPSPELFSTTPSSLNQPLSFSVSILTSEHIRCQGRNLLCPLRAINVSGVQGKESKRARQKGTQAWSGSAATSTQGRWKQAQAGLNVEEIETCQLS